MVCWVAEHEKAETRKKESNEFLVLLEFIEIRSNVKHYKFMREHGRASGGFMTFYLKNIFMCVECITCCVCLSNFCLKFAQLCQYFFVCLFYFLHTGEGCTWNWN